MKWQKLGKIFDVSRYKIFNDSIGFAKGPQAMVLKNFIRIYFSTVKKDSLGKLISHVAFIDIDKTFKNIINISTHEVVPLGNLGCFDEHGIFPFSPIKYSGKIYAYTSGWSRRESVPIETSIGLAISDDNGITFNKVGNGPILTSSTNDPFLVMDGFVRNFNNILYMWYISGTEWIKNNSQSEPERIYKIKYATSKDGINWQTNKQKIIDEKFEKESQALPTVARFNGKYHMFFCYRKSFDFRRNTANSYRIGYAYSSDLLSWKRDDSLAGIDISETGWDSEMLCYPNVFELDNKIYMLYNGNEFGKHGFGLAQLYL